MDNQRMIELTAAVRMTAAQAPLGENGQGVLPIVSLDDSPRALACVTDGEKLSSAATALGVAPPVVLPATASGHDVAQALRGALQTAPSLPCAVAIEQLGLFSLGASRAQALRLARSLLEGAWGGGETDEGRKSAAQLSGHVAIVTGSAQGFGKGIAEELAREGAHVVIADLNDTLGEATRAAIEQECGEGCASFCHADVTDGASLDALVTHAFRTFGGIDLFVANAGVLRAGAIHEMDPTSFELVTKVNYTAFFMGTKAVAPALKLQHVFNVHHQADIIQINSKSGLQGSNRNFAYAGSKFGGIGLVQSFAMELVEHNIKVNAICPGNFFEGPLWSDPDKGLFVQYLKAGKVPGAKTVDDVKRFYMDKVPMRRGCSPLDVTRAILYAHGQEYETGQAIPVTGGQVMLS